MKRWFDEKVRGIYNGPVESAAEVLQVEVKFADAKDAVLGESLLASNAIDVKRNGVDVLARVERPDQATSNRDAAQRLVQPLCAADLRLQDGVVRHQPRDTDAASKKTWHVKAATTLWTTAEDRKAVRTSPSRLLPPGLQPVEGSETLRWADVPDWTLLPRSFVTYLISLVGLLLALDVGLAGTHQLWSPLGIVFATAALISAALLVSPLKGKRKLRWLGALSGVVFVVWGVGVALAGIAPSSVPWRAFLVASLVGAAYITLASLLWTWLRRSSFAGSTFLAIGTGLVAVLGASTWLQQLLARSFQSGLGFDQTPLPIRTLDLLIVGGRTSVLAALGLLTIVLGIIGVRYWSSAEGFLATLQVVVTAPLIALVGITFLLPLFVRVQDVGAEVGRGDVRHASGIAACVRIGTSPDQPLPTAWSEAGVLVGPITGPALFIGKSSGTLTSIFRPARA